MRGIMALEDTRTLKITTHAAAETERLGQKLGSHLHSGDLLCLAGDLGVGKTCLARGLARGWGAVDPVTSPTFTLINEYRRPRDSQRFYHVDCYRLADEADAWTTGLEDVLDGRAVVVVEWPERIRSILPDERLWLQIRDLGGDSREFTLVAYGERAARLLDALRGNDSHPPG
jgi:tRNA threonylcarbamoyladenosine biosynthesis protein TsaE